MKDNKQLTSNLITNILYQELNKYLEPKPKQPNIINITIGNNIASQIYSKQKEKILNTKTLIKYKNIYFDQITYQDLTNYIKELNQDKEVTGITIQLPLPDYLKEFKQEILDTILPSKDLDGLTTTSQNLLKEGSDSLIPCTALGIETLLLSYNINLNNKQIAIINRSNIVGIPLYYLMLRNKSNPIICHSKTIDLPQVTKECDIVVAALNKQEYITKDYLKEGAIVIDVGVHKDANNKTIGDVKYDDVYDKVSLITPPTNAVGPMTICMLAYNATKALYGKELTKILKQAISKAQTITKE